MPRTLFSLLLAVTTLLSGCGHGPAPRTSDEQAMFGTVSFRIHPTFTQIKEWSGHGKPDGIEAVVEFQDQFNDPTRAAGSLRFELYSFRSEEPDHRGSRLAMWSTSLNAHDDQTAHWDAAARGYSFQLGFDKIHPDQSYVLTAQFDRNGTRLFNQIVLEGTTKEGFHGDRRTQHAPSNAPGHGNF
jgi:hypothetical protein